MRKARSLAAILFGIGLVVAAIVLPRQIQPVAPQAAPVPAPEPA